MLAYVYLFEKDITAALRDFEGDGYHFADFLSEYADRKVIVGDGLDLDGNVIARVFLDEKLIYEGSVTQFSSTAKNQVELEDDFNDCNDVDSTSFEDSLSLNNDDAKEFIDASNYFFPNEKIYEYFAIEKVECYSARGVVELKVEDDFKLCQVRPVVADIDSGSTQSLMQTFYDETGLECQILGLRYQGTFYPIDSGDNEGGSNEIFFYERINGGWDQATSIQEKFDEP